MFLALTTHMHLVGEGGKPAFLKTQTPDLLVWGPQGAEYFPQKKIPKINRFGHGFPFHSLFSFFALFLMPLEFEMIENSSLRLHWPMEADSNLKS